MSLIRHKCGRSITLELASEQPEGEGWTRGRVSVTTHPSDVTTKNVTEHCRIALWAPGLRTTHLMIFLVELSHNIHRHQLLPSCFHSSVWKEMVPPRARLVLCKDWSQQWARNPAHLPSGGERRPARPAGALLSRTGGDAGWLVPLGRDVATGLSSFAFWHGVCSDWRFSLVFLRAHHTLF